MYAQMYIKTLNPIYSNRDCSHFWGGFHYNFCHIYLWGSIMEFKRNISIHKKKFKRIFSLMYTSNPIMTITSLKENNKLI